jgi:UMF1 family MFS transporter
VALAGPVLGAIADASGKRRDWIALFSLGIAAGLCGLWLAVPGVPERVPVVAGSFVLAFVCAEFATIFTNAAMPELVPASKLGRLSGAGWAIGYVGGLLSLIFAAGVMVSDPETGVTMLGLKSPLPLDAFAYEGERAIGPFSAVWYALFVLPLFLFTLRGEAGLHAASPSPVREGLAQLRETLSNLRRYGPILRFLLARMLYVDGLGAIFAFGGLYASSVFGWGTTQLGIFGIILTISAAAGAFSGGAFDDRFGSRSVILTALAGLMVSALGIVSIERDSVLFFIDVPAVPGSGFFTTPAEQVYLAFAAAIGVLAGPLQAASRTYLARSAPADMMTEFFGLIAFSGKITAFAAPLLVGLVTTMAQSQRAGVAVILLFLAGGFAVMLTVPRVTQRTE